MFGSPAMLHGFCPVVLGRLRGIEPYALAALIPLLASPGSAQSALGDEGAQFCFEFPIELHETPDRPWELLCDDFDGDGYPEVVAGSFGGGRSSFFRNLGGGRFSRMEDFLPVGVVRRATAGDYDGDGDLDLVLSNSSLGLLMFRNRGDGTFFPPDSLPGGGDSDVTVDIDSDGDLDLLWGAVSIRRNRGNGRFDGVETYPVDGRSPVVADLNGDGFPDVAVRDSSYKIAVLLNQGDGSLSLPTEYDAYDHPADLEAADVDGDGDVDLITAEYNPGGDGPLGYIWSYMSVYRNYGDGTFAPRESHWIGPNAQSMAQGDFDTDGDVDFAILVRDSGIVLLMWNDGSGGFQKQSQVMTHWAYWPYYNWDSVEACDVDADGDQDLLLSYVDGKRIGVLRNLGQGQFQGHARYDAARSPVDVEVTDVEPDGDLDMIVATGHWLDSSNNKTLVYRNDGTGHFGPPDSFDGRYAVVTADFDGDSHVDFVAQSQFSLDLHLNDGQGGFGPRIHIPGLGGAWLVAGDLDGDGDPDLVGRLWDESTVIVRFNDGQAGFSTAVDVDAGGPGNGVAATDVDGDGDIDLITPSTSTQTIAVLENRGDGRFETPAIIAVQAPLHSMACGDLNSDGAPDIALSVPQENRVVVLINQGDGAYLEPVGFPAGRSPQTIGVSDLDGDGHLDLMLATVLWASGDENRIWTLFNRGDGTFESPEEYPSDRGTWFLEGADLDGDGQDEIISSAYESITVRRSSCR